MHVLEHRGRDFHYLNCGIYNQGLITTAKRKDDPTRVCTCGHDQAVERITKFAEWLRDV